VVGRRAVVELERIQRDGQDRAPRFELPRRGDVQLLGAGTKRLKRLEQQKLFKTDDVPMAVEAPASTDDMIAVMDAEMAEA